MGAIRPRSRRLSATARRSDRARILTIGSALAFIFGSRLRSGSELGSRTGETRSNRPPCSHRCSHRSGMLSQSYRQPLHRSCGKRISTHERGLRPSGFGVAEKRGCDDTRSRVRKLDWRGDRAFACAHRGGTRERRSHACPFDSVRGLFSEGAPVYEGSGFRKKTHVQICVRNPNCIKGYFNPRRPVKAWRMP